MIDHSPASSGDYGLLVARDCCRGYHPLVRTIVVQLSDECFERLKVAAAKTLVSVEFEAVARLEDSLGLRAKVPSHLLTKPMTKRSSDVSREKRTIAELVDNYASSSAQHGAAPAPGRKA